MEWIAADSDATRRTSPRVINFSGYVPVWDGLFQSFGESVARTVSDTPMVPGRNLSSAFSSTDSPTFTTGHGPSRPARQAEIAQQSIRAT
jgi:hypothetical protein